MGHGPHRSDGLSGGSPLEDGALRRDEALDYVSRARGRRPTELTFSDLQIRRDVYLVSLRGNRHSPAASAFIALTRRRLRGSIAHNPGAAYMI